MNVQSIDLGYKIRQRVQSALNLSPVVLCLPIARELLQSRELGSLRLILDRFSLRPPRCFYALAHFGKVGFWNIYMKRADGCRITALRLCNCIHSWTPS